MSIYQSKPLATFRSKADTLRLLSGLLKKSSVEELLSFTQAEWEQDRSGIVEKIQHYFQGRTIIVRSSALNEDTVDASNAGAFTSVLHVDSTDSKLVSTAVEQVVASYYAKHCQNPENPILVQSQTTDVIHSGTILTRDYSGAPYYVINYSEDDTTSVTSGQHSKSIKISHNDMVKVPAEFARLLMAVREIQALAPPTTPLDIEFGVKTDGEVITFQVRPLVAAQDAPFEDRHIQRKIAELKNNFKQLTEPRDHLHGEYTLLGDMPDWNPAEIIGSSPHLLAASLYDEIITNHIWHEARTSQGYNNVHPAKLVIQLGNKPYVDVRNTFNSLVPATLSRALKTKLLSFYLEKLKSNPQLQDKVEFDILYTCYDLSFERRAEELLGAGFTAEEVAELRTAVLDLTNNLISVDAITADIQQNEALERHREALPALNNPSPQQSIQRALDLLIACKENGTLQFSRLARLGFISKSLLRSLVEENIVDKDTYDTFLHSVTTVASSFTHDTDLLESGKLSRASFLKKYGHLRPGTYDITIPRYDANEAYLKAHKSLAKGFAEDVPFTLPPGEHTAISAELHKRGLRVTSQELFDFVRKALEGREYSKFLFSKTLSDAIEAIAAAGTSLGLSREDLSHLDMQAIRHARTLDTPSLKSYWTQQIEQNRKSYELNSYILLAPVIFSAEDLDIVSYYDSRPSFITNKKVRGELVFITGEVRYDIDGKIVVIESADPGYDWIFAKGPLALITKYGGPASHMAIRCAEYSLPAVIGVGELWYENLTHNLTIQLDCENERIELTGKMNRL